MQRRPDARDGRVIRVALTERGRRVTDQMLPAHAADIEEMVSFMPRNSLAELSDLLGRLRDGLRERQRSQQPEPVRKPKSPLRRVG